VARVRVWMRLLDRYLLRELLVPLGYCLGGFLVFWMTYDLLTELNNFQRNRLGPGDIVEYYLVKAPEMLVMIIPLALLLALLYALTTHARHHELTAMRAAGLTVWRVALPYFGVALAAAVVLGLLNELAVPEGADKAERILKRRGLADKQGLSRQWRRGLTFINQAEQRTWFIGAYNQETYAMLKPHLEWILPDGTRRQISAERAVRTNDTWLFLETEEVLIPAGSDLPPSPITREALVLSGFTETPRLIQSEIKVSQLDSLKTAMRTHLSIGEIMAYLQLHPRLDAQRRDLLLTMLYSQTALPWTCLVVVLIALPFGAASGRRNVFVGVASSVLICFLFYFVREVSLALGGRLEPWLAAWAPNLLFGLTGIILTQRTR
jgi:lipopolysaccharide export system permease protein